MPKKFCQHSGCGSLIELNQRFCSKHQSKGSSGWADYSKMYTRRWVRFTKFYLSRHALCVLCMKDGRLTASTTVDHVIPHRGDLKLFWQESNLQALCTRCHNQKTAREMNERRGTVDYQGRGGQMF